MIVLTNFFIRKKTSTNTANVAKERLQIIITERKTQKKFEDSRLSKLKNDLLQVIHKHTNETQKISIHLNKKDENTFILKFDIFFTNKKT